MISLARFRQWLGGGPRPPEDAVMIAAPGADEIETAGALVDALTGGPFRLSVVLIAADADEAERLGVRFPSALIRVVPVPRFVSIQASLVALRVRAALVISPGRMGGAAGKLARGAIARGVPVYRLARPADGGATALEPLSDTADAPAGGLDAAGAALFLARSTGVERHPRLSLDRLAARLLRRAPARLTGGYIRRIDSVVELGERLGAPRSLLCLGNGPTSGEPALAELGFDALFRVNIDWRSSGFLTRPDMVFVGVKRAMRRLGPVPLGVATARKEAALLSCRLFEPWHGRASYAVVDRVAAGFTPDVPGPLRPTTGAYMIAVAVALAPERLAVAGMDMFSHADGAYVSAADPTAGGSVNAYTPSHDFETDAAFIAACLAHYEGELIVYSPALRALIEARCAGAKFTLTDRSRAPTSNEHRGDREI